MENRENKYNPWPGLSTYEDPAKSSRSYLFCGRNDETYDVCFLIDNNYLVTLYGKSGIGKSSLLKAGIFPEMRPKHYLPIYVRLGGVKNEEDIIPYQDKITNELESAIKETGGYERFFNVVDVQTDKLEDSYLWNYFARRKFYDKHGHVVFPIIVLDQFEEVLRENETRKKTEILLAQISYLIDEFHVIRDRKVDGELYTYDFNFRFVLSIREDELYRLEDSIDSLYLPALKKCRYRLRNLSDQSARDVILLPGNNLFCSTEQEEIAQAIIKKASNSDDKCISSSILSLLCNRIFEENKDALPVDLLLVEKFIKGDPFENFFHKALKDLSEKEKIYLEEKLIDSTGKYRDSIPEADFENFIQKENAKSLLEGEDRILQRVSGSSDGSHTRIELIHDKFCEPLSSLRDKRRRRKRILFTFISIITIIVLASLSITQIRLNTNRLHQENLNSIVVRLGEECIDHHDNLTAKLLAINILPTELDSPDKLFSPDAERLLRRAVKNDDAILKGHTGAISFVSYSPNEKYIASASKDTTIIIWDAQTGAPLYRLLGHTAQVASASFSPDGKYIVSASFDRTLRIWDVQTGEQIGNPLERHSDWVNSAFFSPDGRLLVSASDDRTVRIWDVQLRKQIGQPLLHRSPVKFASFSPDGKYIVSATVDGIMIVWDAQSGNPVGKPLIGHLDCINSAFYSPDGKYIVSASNDKTVRIWEATTRKEAGDYLAHDDRVSFATFSPDCKYIVSASRDNMVRVWELQSRFQTRGPLVGHSRYVTSVSFSPDGKYIISGSEDNSVRIWDIHSDVSFDGIIKEVNKNTSVKSASFSPDGRYVVSASSDNIVRIWEVATGKLMRDSLIIHNMPVNFASFSPDGRYVVSASDDNSIKIVDAVTGIMISDTLKHFNYVNTVSYSPDGKFIVSASDDKTIKIWDATTFKLHGDSLVGHSDNVNSAFFSPDSKYIVSASNDKTVRIWDVKTGKQVGKPLKGHLGWVRYASFSPDSKYIVSASDDKTMRIWDAKTGKQVGKPLKGHTDWVNSAAYSPNGKYIVSASNDNTVRLWSVRTGKQIGESLKGDGPLCYFNTAFFSPNGIYIVSSSNDGFMKIWNYPPLQQLIDETREKLKNRHLSEEERKRYYLD